MTLLEIASLQRVAPQIGDLRKAKEQKMRLINPTRAEERIVALYRKEKGYAADIFNTAVDAAQTIILDMYDNEAIEAEPNSCEYWDSESRFCALRRPQAEPIKHGHWIFFKVADWGASNCKCSVCGEEEFVIPTKPYRYCRWCGAKMDESTIGQLKVDVSIKKPTKRWDTCGLTEDSVLLDTGARGEKVEKVTE